MEGSRRDGQVGKEVEVEEEEVEEEEEEEQEELYATTAGEAEQRSRA